MSMLAEMTWGQWALGSFLVFTCFILMLVILLQKGRGGGFSGAFGGAGGSSAFGAKTGDVFTWITVIVAGVFVVLTVWSNFVFDESLRPKLASDAAQTTTLDLPLEGLDGAQPGQPIKMELGIVDPTTGEKSTILVPSKPSTPPDGAAPAGQPYDATIPKPAESAQPSSSAADQPATPTKEPPPEGEKKDDNENRPNP
ncbi:MAG: preprotein translocase subunit SecG [Planctomycetota bacterium]